MTNAQIGANWTIAAVMCLCFAPSSLCRQQERSTAQPGASSANDAPVAKPNRPSSSNSADVLDAGILQFEYGYSRECETRVARPSAVGGEPRFGVWKNIEIRWGGSSFVHDATLLGASLGFGDQYLSGRMRLKPQSENSPAIVLSYAINLPTGNAEQGLGSGSVDHFWTFLANKDIHKVAVDFNAGYQLVGRPGVNRTRAKRAFHSDYKLHRQVVLDAARDVGITNSARINGFYSALPTPSPICIRGNSEGPITKSIGDDASCVTSA
jgi:hypothetical protein